MDEVQTATNPATGQHVERRDTSPPLNGISVLQLVQQGLKRYLQTGEQSTFNLHTLDLAGSDRRVLQNALGNGEVEATVTALGHTDIYETSIAGVWWITDYNEQGRRIADRIEVTDVPVLITADRQEMTKGIDILRDRIDRADRTMYEQAGSS